MLPSALLLIAAMIAGGWLVQRAVRGEGRSARDSAQLLESVMERVRASYVEPVDEDALWELAAIGLVGELGDPNTAYLSPDRLEKLNESSANTYHGVGMTLDVRDGVVIVMQTRSGSPAERAGILAGDRIVEVNEQSMQGATME
jgi:carboxyl-terminal processing protease